MNLSDTAHQNPDNPRPYAYLYENLCVYFLGWYLPTTIIVGAMGTLFSLFFLFCSKLFKSNMLIWLSSICIGDFLILMLEGLWILLKVWFKYDIRDQNDVICVLHKAASNYAIYWSAYMQCALSVERAYLVFKPLHARVQGGVSKRHAITWIIISLLLITPVMPYMIYWRVIDGDCDPTDRAIFYLTTVTDLIVWGIVPLLGMTVATVVICLNMARVGKKFNKSTAYPQKWTRKHSTITGSDSTGVEKRRGLSISALPISSSKSNPDIHTLSTRTMTHLDATNLANTRVELTHAKLQRQLTEQSSSRHNAQDNFGHVTRLLVCMNVAYMTSTFPLLIYLMYRNFSGVDVDPDVHRFFYYMCRSLCFLNSCTNWIFYCLVGKLFRAEAKHILLMCCGMRSTKSARGYSSPLENVLAPVQGIPTPTVTQHVCPGKRTRSISAAEIQRVVSAIPPR
ncbi:unnamed protein product [Mesocestoides corti]|uniref:G_PROTEIN_RECEP_F1_2 domain-containing protein n=1 Tax=Mesocestoides corti TaxID=53468 RepID=A0A0R3UPE2_MESCO|nr:unnamed protein product [Mesocestoides corti]